jgi:hypothetical protein
VEIRVATTDATGIHGVLVTAGIGALTLVGVGWAGCQSR